MLWRFRIDGWWHGCLDLILFYSSRGWLLEHVSTVIGRQKDHFDVPLNLVALLVTNVVYPRS